MTKAHNKITTNLTKIKMKIESIKINLIQNIHETVILYK